MAADEASLLLWSLNRVLVSSLRQVKRLYSSKADGHSLNRLGHKIVGYKGATLAVFKVFEMEAIEPLIEP